MIERSPCSDSSASPITARKAAAIFRPPGLIFTDDPVEKRYDDDIQGRNKSVLAGCCILQTIRLKLIGQAEKNAEDHAANDRPVVSSQQIFMEKDGKQQCGHREADCQKVCRRDNIHGIFLTTKANPQIIVVRIRPRDARILMPRSLKLFISIKFLRLFLFCGLRIKLHGYKNGNRSQTSTLFPPL